MIANLIAKLKKMFRADDNQSSRQMIVGLLIGVGGTAVVAGLIVIMMLGGSIGSIVSGRALFDAKWIPDSLKGDSDGMSMKLKVVVIKPKNCDDCFDIQPMIDAMYDPTSGLKPVSVQTVDADSRDGQRLIERYNITRVPTILFVADFDANEDFTAYLQKIGRIQDGVFVFENIGVPYIDTTNGQKRGDVDVTYLTDSQCANCYDVSLHDRSLTYVGVAPVSTSTVDIGSDQGKELIKKYNIEAVPTIVIEGDVAAYKTVIFDPQTNTSVTDFLDVYGTMTEDGSYFFTAVDQMGTYRDLKTGKIVEVKIDELVE